jgi:hypothetical protein
MSATGLVAGSNATRGREYHVNADFDLSLRPRRIEGVRSGSRAQIRELPLHLLLMGGPDDSMRAHAPAPGELVDNLGRLGFELPRVTVRPAVRREAELVPFGWNGATARLNRRYATPAFHPPLEVVRRVNGRSFLAAIEANLGGTEFVVGRFAAFDELERFLRSTPAPAGGWVVKAEHGNAALGNRRLAADGLDEADRRYLAAVLGEDDRVLVEPWLDRCGDLSATFRVEPDGRLVDLETHEVVNTADGAFIGARFGGDQPDGRWQAEMGEAATRVARHLADAGYSGPACLDGLLWRDRGVIRLRPLVDLNARLHVSLAALTVWRGWDQERVVYWRFFSRRKLTLPDHLDGVASALGEDAYDPGDRNGIVLTSPLWVDDAGRFRRPSRLGVLFAGASAAATHRLERRFRELFE